MQTKIKKNDIFGLHFYNNSYRNKELVEWIFNLVDEKERKKNYNYKFSNNKINIL
jgi:hypothetical protein